MLGVSDSMSSASLREILNMFSSENQSLIAPVGLMKQKYPYFKRRMIIRVISIARYKFSENLE
jgi:hypothetical protein